MKLEIKIDPGIDETLVKIFANSVNSEVTLIQSLLESPSLQRIIGFQNEVVRILEPREIIRFYTDNKKVYAQTEESTYLVRLRMYDLEERFYSKSFLRISQGELVNLDYVKRLDLSYKGTIAVELTNGDISFVSRRSLSKFKEFLGI
ncbi:LytTR family DNA-binding domain-containing protein [Facklamia miroungae]|uniref:LytTr DNA-binding domain-containing protein n=1 Tax=Facklamia miroungae TaxID=120956 RepID=A0A1G7UZ69_9LACT|nr:LytTR family DNA-binding domain-containing protein [Facklamia miroungae]NKZ30198.1 LytTR family transcriptional regulator [Facklamia miroungae]SDG52598.1 LytTr DNA-binding domain-containing protein [Facklamia miroungae]